jgi:hypothetical protein
MRANTDLRSDGHSRPIQPCPVLWRASHQPDAVRLVLVRHYHCHASTSRDQIQSKSYHDNNFFFFFYLVLTFVPDYLGVN